MGPVLAGVLAGRGCSALVFHGDDGLDELTTTGPSTVWVVRDGAVAETRFDPAEIGIPRCEPDDLRGGDPAHNAAVVRSVLAGERGPVRETVLLNAGAALVAEAGAAEPGTARYGAGRRATRGRRRRSTPALPPRCSTPGSRPASGWRASQPRRGPGQAFSG